VHAGPNGTQAGDLRGIATQVQDPRRKGSGAGGADVKVEDRTIEIKSGKAHFPNNEKGKQPAYASSSNCVITSKYTVITFLPVSHTQATAMHLPAHASLHCAQKNSCSCCFVASLVT